MEEEEIKKYASGSQTIALDVFQMLDTHIKASIIDHMILNTLFERIRDKPRLSELNKMRITLQKQQKQNKTSNIKGKDKEQLRKNGQFVSTSAAKKQTE